MFLTSHDCGALSESCNAAYAWLGVASPSSWQVKEPAALGVHFTTSMTAISQNEEGCTVVRSNSGNELCFGLRVAGAWAAQHKCK